MLLKLVTEFSVSKLNKFSKMLFALWSGFFLCYVMGYPELAITFGSSAYLTIALGTTYTDSKNYFTERFLANVITLIVGVSVYYFIPNIAVCLMIVSLIMVALANLYPNSLRSSSVGAAITLIVTTIPDISYMEKRIFVVIVGMFYGYIIQRYIIPPNHGYQLEKLINTTTNDVVKLIKTLDAENLEVITKEQLISYKANSIKISELVLNFKKDSGKTGPHYLLQYKAKAPYFEQYSKLLQVKIDIINKLFIHKEKFKKLDYQTRKNFFIQLKALVTYYEYLIHYVEHQDAEFIPLFNFDEKYFANAKQEMFIILFESTLIGYYLLLEECYENISHKKKMLKF
ncbi:FUSC family protein (plasmid) [Bacillus sp. JAS24-2]|uniref:FUSC family protein n=1 Tax=Bacillus sp. JAS24-2 TaxID=2217832 RepID=UPI0011EBB614|nr:FUSC family protein [Bacillus sp. JAS24-2]QEL82868.1 FUSC family protein [Bacillus sp. JAS24-2]